MREIIIVRKKNFFFFARSINYYDKWEHKTQLYKLDSNNWVSSLDKDTTSSFWICHDEEFECGLE